VRLFIDESLSPSIATRLNETGSYDATHPLHVGRRRERDDTVLMRCLAEDRVLITQNARDFRPLVARVELHPGLIILPGLDRHGTWALLRAALAWLEGQGDRWT
jgi:predicted nuclease of predicted toxin-antitoxin system